MIQEEKTNQETVDTLATDTTGNSATVGESQDENVASEQTPEQRIEELEQQLAEQKDTYLRLMAEFDNYRKNQIKRLQDTMRYGGEEAFKGLLPVVDDMERALESIEKSDDLAAAKEGITLIYQKFIDYLKKNKVEAIAPQQGDAFDESMHDAITMFPAPDPSLKGKVVDCPTKGYRLDDKVIRYAKVVVGQ